MTRPSIVEFALSRTADNNAIARQVADSFVGSKSTSDLLAALSPSPGVDLWGSLSDNGSSRERYRLFRGWVYSAVNALAIQGAGQSANVVRLLGGGDQKAAVQGTKASQAYRQKMPIALQRKAANQQIEVLNDHPLLQALEKPNPIQYRFQFIYSFIANLALTGWSYIIGGTTDTGQMEFYSVPTTWIRPVHTDGLFSGFVLVNPKRPTAEGIPIPKENVAFAQLPDPSDIGKALSPAAAQDDAIVIDDKMQSSQRVFFDNGIFPSVIVTIGHDPHPDVPGGIRPRLTAGQRRQVIGAIRKVTGGVANYGSPAIVDGLIEKIEKLSMNQTEMGWEKSEQHVRTRILSAFGVHPFILGETMAGSYAQAYVVKDQFCSRVNTFLDLLGVVMTDFGVAHTQMPDDNLKVWYDPCVATDPALDQKLWTDARKNQDVTQNEFRAFMGLPPDVDRNESVLAPQSIQGVTNIAVQVRQGALEPTQAAAILRAVGLPTDLAEEIAGTAGLLQDGVDALNRASGILEKTARAFHTPDDFVSRLCG